MEKDKISVLVVFGNELPTRWQNYGCAYNVVVAVESLKESVDATGCKFIPIEPLIEAGSIYEASAFVEELSRLTLPNGGRLSKSFVYQGYELWWMYYNSLFYYFGLPYTQHKRLLEFIRDFRCIHFYRPPFKSLFFYYLEAKGREIKTIREPGFKIPRLLPFGVLVQIVATVLSLPVLLVTRPRLMVFIGDKFEKSKDFDFRMRFIYKELRARGVYFVEFIRSLESWKTVLLHIFVRKRPVVYSEAIDHIGRLCNFIVGGRFRMRRKFNLQTTSVRKEPATMFKLLVATHYLLDAHHDVWSIRIMKIILRAVGVQSGLFTAALDRNLHAVLGCKLNTIPTVGILHGVASRHYNVYDFLPGFDCEKMLSVDKYGLWSEWWKKYYLENSRAYRPDQLYVSGPMRPLEEDGTALSAEVRHKSGSINVLFVSEQLAVPEEVVPYLEVLLREPELKVTISFRPYRDRFKIWLDKCAPELLKHPNMTITEGVLQGVIQDSDVAVGSHSTAVLETLLQLKVPIFFQTKKWGDYYDLKKYDREQTFFADNPRGLVDKVKNAHYISPNTLNYLRERYFGDPHKNGSKWAVSQAIDSLFVK